ncbi:MAG: response regulator [bacterium]
MPTRILIVDDSASYRRSVSGLIDDEPDLEVVGTAANFDQAVALARTRRPQVAVVDLWMPDAKGIDVTRALMAECPGLRVLGVSLEPSPKPVAEMCAAGAEVVLSKGTSNDELIARIRGQAAAQADHS